MILSTHWLSVSMRPNNYAARGEIFMLPKYTPCWQLSYSVYYLTSFDFLHPPLLNFASLTSTPAHDSSHGYPYSAYHYIPIECICTICPSLSDTRHVPLPIVFDPNIWRLGRY